MNRKKKAYRVHKTKVIEDFTGKGFVKCKKCGEAYAVIGSKLCISCGKSEKMKGKY